MTTRDIEIKVDKDEKIKKINKEIKERHEKYISIVNDLEKGFDRTTGTYIYDKNAIDMILWYIPVVADGQWEILWKVPDFFYKFVYHNSVCLQPLLWLLFP